MTIPMASRKSNEIIEPRLVFEDVPISALRQKTRSKLSILLNPEKVLVNEDGYFRDWRGIYTLSGLTQSEYALISQSDDKMNKLLDIWIRKNVEGDVCVTLSQLMHCFAIIDRYDIYDDTMALFSDDAMAFKSKETQPVISPLPIEPENSNVLTILDDEYYREGRPLPIYDALVIYSDKDADFTADLVKRLRDKNYLLCLKDDLLPGLPFEFDSLLTLLSKRCNRLIAVISKEFLASKMNGFFTNYAQALGIEQGKRKIIPCVLEPCDLPQMLTFCYRLEYFRNNKLFDFWDKLDKSLKLTVEDKKAIKRFDSPPMDDLVFKFTETPSTPEKIKKHNSENSQIEPKRQIMPPPPRLRQSSSMAVINSTANGSINQQFSHSSQKLNDTVDGETTSEAIKLKRKKWYRVFLPPQKEKVKAEGIENEPMKKEKKKKWYKSKKKEKIAVQF